MGEFFSHIHSHTTRIDIQTMPEFEASESGKIASIVDSPDLFLYDAVNAFAIVVP